MTQSLSLRSSGETGIYSVLKIFSLWFQEDCVIKSRGCLFLARRSFTEELLFKLVLKHEYELPAGQESGHQGRGQPEQRCGGGCIFESLKETACRCGPQYSWGR